MDIEVIIQIIGVALVAVILTLIIKQYKPEYAVFITIIASGIIFALLITGISPALDMIKKLLNNFSGSIPYVEVVIKTLGICYITTLVSDICRDAGQNVMATKVELAGKVFIVILSLPLFDNIIKIAMKLL